MFDYGVFVSADEKDRGEVLSGTEPLCTSRTLLSSSSLKAGWIVFRVVVVIVVIVLEPLG